MTMMLNFDLLITFGLIGLVMLILFPLARKAYATVVTPRGEESVKMLEEFDVGYKMFRRIFWIAFSGIFVVMFALHPIQTDMRTYDVNKVELTNEAPATKAAITASNLKVERRSEIEMKEEVAEEQARNLSNFNDFLDQRRGTYKQ